MLKKFWTKFMAWKEEQQYHDYYDPYAGIAILAKKRKEKKD
jgi:hypothetical protein